MNVSLYWMQCGGCGGDSISLLNADSPNIVEAFEAMPVDLLWHPLFSHLAPAQHQQLVRELLSDERPLDILCLEGSVITGPDQTGLFDNSDGIARKEMIRALAARAGIVVAIGTCAAFGGVTRAGGVGASGLQFNGRVFGGFLGTDFRSKRQLPVINLPGCPVHPAVIIGALGAYLHEQKLPLNTYNAPLEYYGSLVHQGCTRNEYHEFQIEDADFGQNGCLFFHLGCHGPLTHAPCNKFLWNNRNCKTRSGSPCLGCTEPDFPQPEPFFATPNIVGFPINLPDGVDRSYYLAYKGIAAAAAPERLRLRQTRV